MTDASANTRICLRFLAAARGHHRIFGVCNGRQLKIDAPLSPTIFLPIFVFKFASGYAAPPVCSVGVILTVYRGQGFTSDGGLSLQSLFFCFFFCFTLSWRLARGKLYTNSFTCLIRDVSRYTVKQSWSILLIKYATFFLKCIMLERISKKNKKCSSVNYSRVLKLIARTEQPIEARRNIISIRSRRISRTLRAAHMHCSELLRQIVIKCPELRGYPNAFVAGSRLAGTDNSRRPGVGRG